MLLADPTQAKVKVKFEGKAAGEPENKIENSYVSTNYLNELDIKTVKI